MQRFIILLSIATLLLVGGLVLNFSMPMQDGKMANCPLMNNSSSFCQMGVTEHIAKWQEMFLAIPFSGVLLTLLLGIVLAVWYLSQRTYFSLSPPLKLKFYKKEHPDIKLFDNLLLAFSNGILHPKIYA